MRKYIKLYNKDYTVLNELTRTRELITASNKYQYGWGYI